MKTKLSIVLFLALTAFSSQSFAQEAAYSSGDAAALSPGTLGISAGILDLGILGSPSGVVGGKYFLSDALNLGVNFGLRLERGVLAQGNGDWALLVAPNLQYYFKTGNKVTPFIFGQFQIAAQDSIGDVEPDISMGFGGGAEYFVYDYFGISAQLGLNLFLAPTFGLGTFSTSLNANFYF